MKIVTFLLLFYLTFAHFATSHAAEPTASMGGFRTFAEIESALDWLSATFPAVISSKFSIGHSVEGRDLWAIRVSDNPNVYEANEPTAWFDALHHAREPMSAEALLRFTYDLATRYGADGDVTRLLQSRNIILLPCVNPDGYEYNRIQHPDGGGLWRKNRRDNGDGSFGVDLNRNYSWQWGRDARLPSSPIYQGTAPFSEPETAAIQDFLVQQTPTVSVFVHSYGNEWAYPWGWSLQPAADDTILSHYAKTISAANGYTNGTAWDIYGFSYGASDDYHYATYGSLAYTVEIGSARDGFWPDPSRIPLLFETVRPGLQRMAQTAGAWAGNIRPTWREQQGNGDPWLDPGEQWILRLSLENQGALPLNAQVSLAGQQAVLVLAPLQAGESDNLTLDLPTTSAPETAHVLDMILEYDGVTSSVPLKIHFGPQRILINDDMENADSSWRVSNPEQDWAWLRAIPQSSLLGEKVLQVAKTEGATSWVTGATAGNRTGDFDVDGATWLTSPRFQAAGLRHLQLSYSRWFVNVGDYQDDYLTVEASNDDGTTWVTLESVKNSKAWETVRFDLEDYLALSDDMRVRFRTEDSPNNDLTEAAMDDFVLSTYSYAPLLTVWGQAAPGETLRLTVDGPANTQVTLFGAFQAGAARYFDQLDGAVYLHGEIFPLLQGMTDAQGRTEWQLTMPADFDSPTIYLQALFDSQEQPQVSRLSSLRGER